MEKFGQGVKGLDVLAEVVAVVWEVDAGKDGVKLSEVDGDHGLSKLRLSDLRIEGDRKSKSWARSSRGALSALGNPMGLDGKVRREILLDALLIGKARELKSRQGNSKRQVP